LRKLSKKIQDFGKRLTVKNTVILQIFKWFSCFPKYDYVKEDFAVHRLLSTIYRLDIVEEQ